MGHLGFPVEISRLECTGVQKVQQIAQQNAIPQDSSQGFDFGIRLVRFVIRWDDFAPSQPGGAFTPKIVRHGHGL